MSRSLSEVRAEAGQIGGLTSWANTVDRAERMAPAHAAAWDRFEREVRAKHPEATDQQVAQMADAARRAHFARMAYESAKARRKAKGGDAR
jgi:predicted negative regulator of RcsB-dependent stress response